MNDRIHLNRRTFAAMLTLAPVLAARAADFVDPLAQAAQSSPLASRSLLTAVTRAGQRLIAVGQRGHIVLSDDHGKSWTQVPVPVSTDLNAVCFVDADKGWAVGHDGVILHTEDGGRTWVKQFDGNQANALLVADMERKAAASGQDARMQSLLAEARRYLEEGADKPFLDVWFTDGAKGFAVGAYNLLFRTTDAGAHWEPWFERTDNPKFLHLNAIRGVGDELYVTGEAGLFLRLDREGQRFVAAPVPYQGSFFSMTATPAGVLLFGMRGNAYRSADKGASWKKVAMDEGAGLSGATVLDDGRIVAVSQAGRVHLSKDGGQTFSVVPGIRPMIFAAVSAATSNLIALAGVQGVQIGALPL